MVNINSPEFQHAMKTFARIVAETFSDNYEYFWEKGMTYIDPYVDSLLPPLAQGGTACPL